MAGSEEPKDPKFTKGRELAARLFEGAPRGRRLPPEMTEYTMSHLFGDVWQGEELSLEERSLITCAVLTALGREPELRLHIRGAKNLGLGDAKLEAMMTHVAHYAGWPTGASALRTLAEVSEDMG